MLKEFIIDKLVIRRVMDASKPIAIHFYNNTYSYIWLSLTDIENIITICNLINKHNTGSNKAKIYSFITKDSLSENENKYIKVNAMISFYCINNNITVKFEFNNSINIFNFKKSLITTGLTTSEYNSDFNMFNKIMEKLLFSDSVLEYAFLSNKA